MKKSKEDNKESHYIFFKTESSFCPECSENAYLLTSDENKGKPAFYICFNCKFVGEVGVGRVRTERE